jgi:cytochrome c peroxidase
MLKKTTQIIFSLIAGITLIVSCQKQDVSDNSYLYTAINTQFGNSINPNQLYNYAGQPIPGYINRDNTRGNSIQNAKATLGRVLFYDRNLSTDRSISCASCHQQSFAFSDTALVSSGVENGKTTRHSMRLINSRFAQETRFFWNKRAASLEVQTTMPIQDHAEMGFSGTNGRPGLEALLTRLQQIDYYQALFRLAYGDPNVSEVRMQECLSQFIRSIQSFDSKYDVGRSQVNNDAVNFPNFTQQENSGKNLFLSPPVFDATGSRIGGGLGCGGCHRAPEFDIDPNSGNNGIVGIIGAPGLDLNNTRAPSLRDLIRTDGVLNGPMMHTGVIQTLQAAIGHYGTIIQAPGNNLLDRRLLPSGNGQRLNLNAAEVNSVIAFMKTLSGTAVYSAPQWSNPFP